MENYFLVLGILTILYAIVIFIIYKNRYDVERNNLYLLVIPIAMMLANFTEEKETLNERLLTLVITFIIVMVLALIIIKIGGLQFNIKSSYDNVLKVIGNIDDYIEQQQLETKNKKVFKNKEKDVIRVYKGKREKTVITINTTLNKLFEQHKIIALELVAIDNSMTTKIYSAKLIIAGVILIIIGILS